MKNKSIFLFLLGLPVIFTGCMDVIEKPDSSSAGEYIWDDYTMGKMYLDNLYLENLPEALWDGDISETTLGECMRSTEEAYGLSGTSMLYGSAIIGSVNSYSEVFWNQMRRINLMIQEVQEKSTLDESQKRLLLGQARFLRAIRYWELVRVYGGVPILTKPLDIAVDDMDIPRSSTEACVDFIVEDLDYAASVLPANWLTLTPDEGDYGRLTSLAALAYKGRVLLHFASPMFMERDAYTAYDNTAVPEVIADAGVKTARWQAAYEANKIAYDSLVAQGYALIPDYKDIFKTEGYSNTEAVLVRVYTGQTYVHDWESQIRPSSQNGIGQEVNPTWELVKSFLTADGKRVSEEGSGYLDKYFWIDRDPRFYQTIVYNGANWDMDKTVGRKQWCYIGSTSEQNITTSGFYVRKAQDATLGYNSLANGKIDWIEIRLAEVMLNLAEAANETGHQSLSVELIRSLRRRAGILEGPNPSEAYGVSNILSQTDMLDLIMNERLIELAFENQRYWDLRRRMMYTRNLSSSTLKLNDSKRRGLLVAPLSSTKKDWLNANRDTLTLTKSNYYNYFVPFYLKSLERNPNHPDMAITYLPYYYFAPIPSNMFSNSARLEQTLGWASGTFDPLAE